MQAGLDFGVLKESDTWKAFGIGVVLFCIIGFASLSLFGLTSSIYGTSDEISEVPDWVAPSMNREGIDDLYTAEDGTIQLSSLRGHVVILDFMAIDCANCLYVQEHIDDNLAEWEGLDGEYPVIAVSIATWYQYESFEQINATFGDPESNRHMPWPFVNGGDDVVLLEDGERGDITEYYSAQSIPLALVIDHEGFVVAKENTGTPLDGWKSFDSAIEAANLGEAEDLRIGIKKADRSVSGAVSYTHLRAHET